MIDEQQKMLICHKIKAGIWTAAGYTGQDNIEKIIARWLSINSVEFLYSNELSMRLRRLIFGNKFTAY